MTPCSAACGGSCSRRSQLAVGLLADVVGQRDVLELLAQLARLLGDSSNSPSSSWIALSCWRRTYSRWPLSISDWTWVWISEPIEMTSSSRASDSARRRSRLATSTSSSSACFSSVGSRSEPAIRWLSVARVVDVGDRELQLLGQVGTCSTIS